MVTASVIILNYNGGSSLSECLEKLYHQKLSFNVEIIIVDNASSDNSLELSKQIKNSNKHVLSTKYYALSTNLGFAAGNNYGIRHSSGKYITLINNDCLPESSWLSQLINTIHSDPNIFSVTSKIKKYPETLNQIQNAGSLVFQDGFGRDIGAIVSLDHQQSYEIDNGQFDEPSEVYSGCGAAILFSKKILDTIEYLNENFFMYYEDTEICERARLAGYQNSYCPTAIVYHHHAKSSNEWSPFFIYHSERGRLLHLLYHFPISVYFAQLSKFSIKSILRFAKSLVTQKNILKNWQYIKIVFDQKIHLLKNLQIRHNFSKIYPPANRQIEYNKILSGYWYFK
ncbi:glycosyltransferase family 2 protein [Candidatus Shapirobacteria bacterium]|nr:glycosyltransferase family 2 protein [Candidatus Shapirobacteria bacterium]